MKATDALKKEHEAVRLMMKIMDAACVKINAQQKLQTADIDDMIDFLKVFVDRCHHGKEEQILFPQLELAGVPKEGGPIGVMLAEHEQGRVCIRNMSQAVVDYKAGNTAAITALVDNIAAYNELLDQHINKENTVLFAMADGVVMGFALFFHNFSSPYDLILYAKKSRCKTFKLPFNVSHRNYFHFLFRGFIIVISIKC